MQALKTRLERERMIAESWSRKLVWEAPGLLEVPSDNGEGIHCDVKLGVNHQLLSGILKLETGLALSRVVEEVVEELRLCQGGQV